MNNSFKAMSLLKFIFFVIYSLATIIFMYYVNISYLYTLYKDWLFCDFKNMSKFDYIIVGAGSAGSVLAARLSNAGARTLLVEAGGPPIPLLDIPLITPLLMNTVYDWKYVTVPQKHACKGLENNQSAWSAGKILGGSSRLNYMLHVQGHSDDYKLWFPDFKETTVKYKDTLHIDDQYWHSELSDAILQGVAEMSHLIKNINEELSTGFMRAHLTMKNGERWSTDKIIYQNNNNKLKIITNSFVNKILFKSNKAVGVEFFKNNKIYKAFARHGVISSAGSIGTPKLLMLSGIGPKQHLKDLNIKSITDLPVGQNLMDHIITGFDLVTLNSSKGLSVTNAMNPYSMLEYYLFGKGPWTSGGVDVIGTFYSKYKNEKSGTPDLQIMVFSVGLSQDNGVILNKNLRISNEVFRKYFAPLTYKTAITIAPVLLHPKSLGEVKLKSSDPFDSPIIDPKYLSNEDDVLTLIEGIEFIKKLIKTKSMKKLDAQLYETSFPGCENFNFDTLEYWKCYVRHLTLTTYHPVGTCKLGSVVDSKFRVYNIENLFVVDASVFPQLSSGNIHTPILMLSEKAASIFINDFIKSKTLLKCSRSDIFLLFKTCY